MGVWAERVVPRLTDVGAGQRGHRRAASGRLPRPARPGAGDRLRQRAQPPALPARGRRRSAPSSRPTPAGRCPGAAGPAARSPSSGPGSTASGSTAERRVVRRRPGDVHAVHDPRRGRRPGEVRRVLRPGGLFHFLEHGLAPDAAVVTWQHRLEPLQRRVFAGCHLTRDVPALVADAGPGDHPAGAALPARAGASAGRGRTATSAAPCARVARGAVTASRVGSEPVSGRCAPGGRARR